MEVYWTECQYYDIVWVCCMFGNCNHCCFCCGHPCTMLGVSLFISCKKKKKVYLKNKVRELAIPDVKRLICVCVCLCIYIYIIYIYIKYIYLRPHLQRNKQRKVEQHVDPETHPWMWKLIYNTDDITILEKGWTIQ